MERLWSPWRLAYVTGQTGDKDQGRCVFCDAADPAPDPSGQDSLVLVRGRLSYVILNLYPYNNGHLMVVPKRHIASLAETTAEERAEMMTFARDAEAALIEGYQPQGINVGINLGRPAGAGIVDHLHMHFVPRWTGDTNFMSVVGGTRVLPEDMQETVARLRPIFERLKAGHESTKNWKD
jgi:ATP adenylyltransferase